MISHSAVLKNLASVPYAQPLQELLNDEWIYLDVFTFDYATFAAFGETTRAHAVLDPLFG